MVVNYFEVEVTTNCSVRKRAVVDFTIHSNRDTGSVGTGVMLKYVVQMSLGEWMSS